MAERFYCDQYNKTIRDIFLHLYKILIFTLLESMILRDVIQLGWIDS